jgi:hypothetical protein
MFYGLTARVVLARAFLWACGFPAAFVAAGLMLDLLFIFIGPCAGWHSLSLLRQRK